MYAVPSLVTTNNPKELTKCAQVKKIVTQKGQRQCVLLLGCASMLRSIKCLPQ